MAHAPPLVAVVDDDARVRTALQRLLRSTGFAVEAFASGEEFLAVVDAVAPDCVLLDLHMPGVSGFDVQERLARRGSPVPVVAITGQDSPTTRARTLTGGARSYLCKPIDKDALISAIGKAIGASAATR